MNKKMEILLAKKLGIDPERICVVLPIDPIISDIAEAILYIDGKRIVGSQLIDYGKIISGLEF